MVLFRGRFIGPLKPLRLGDQNIDWVTHSRLLGVTIDNKLTWSRHILEVKKAFALKLNLIKRSRFLPRNMLLDLYFKIILPGVTYALPIWGGHCNKDGFKSLESLHCRAARIIFNFLRDMPSEEVLEKAKWDSIFYKYKLGLAKLVYKVYNDLTPPDMRHIIVKAENKHGLRNGYKVVVPRFFTNFMKNSIAYRGSVIWNALSQRLHGKTSNFKSFFNIVKGKNILKNISFEALSTQTVRLNDDVFKFY